MKTCIICKGHFESKSNNAFVCSPECALINKGYTITNDGCHKFDGYIHPSGYGFITHKGIKKAAHRISCEKAHGSAPKDKPHVLHKCNNPSCINPEHLRWGNAKENMNDMVESGNAGKLKGEYISSSKLSNNDILDIRSQCLTYQRGLYEKLASKYGVNRTTIYNIRDNRSWKHI